MMEEILGIDKMKQTLYSETKEIKMQNHTKSYSDKFELYDTRNQEFFLDIYTDYLKGKLFIFKL